MKFWNAWMVTRFWWWWGGAAIIVSVVLCVFRSLLARGVVTSDNIIPWSAILLLLFGTVGSSVWLKSTNHQNIAVLPLLLLIVPLVVCVVGSLLFSALYFLIFMFGHGRVN